MKKIIFALVLSFTLVGCSETPSKSKEINLYSQRHYEVDKLQYKKFEESTGIKVNVIKANADELIERMRNEGKNSPADLFITVDVGKLYQASQMGLLQKIKIPSILDKVSGDLIDRNGFYIRA